MRFVFLMILSVLLAGGFELKPVYAEDTALEQMDEKDKPTPQEISTQIRALAQEEAARQAEENKVFQAQLEAAETREEKDALRTDFYKKRQEDGQKLQDKIRALRVK